MGPFAEPDHYDRNALQIVARYGGEIVGTMRLIDSTKASAVLEVARVDFPEEITPDQRFELSGLSVAREHRGRGRLAFLGMLDIAVRHCASHGRPYLLCLMHRKQLASFVSINPRVRMLDMTLRSDQSLPPYMAKRIVERWPDYRLAVFDLRDVSYDGTSIRQKAIPPPHLPKASPHPPPTAQQPQPAHWHPTDPSKPPPPPPEEPPPKEPPPAAIDLAVEAAKDRCPRHTGSG